MFECHLLQLSVDGQRLGAVEDADVVESEEAARKDVLPPGVLPVDPPEGKKKGRLEQFTIDSGQTNAILVHLFLDLFGRYLVLIVYVYIKRYQVNPEPPLTM